MSDEKLHEIEIVLTEIKSSDKSSHRRIDGLESNVKTIDNKVQTNIDNLNKTTVLIEGLIKTVTEMQESVKSINQLAFSVHEIANEMKAMRTDLNKVDTKVDDYNSKITERVKNIEEKPAKRYEAIAEKFILVVVGGIASYFLMKLGM